MRFLRELRLIPVVALAAAALFVLKTTAIVIEGGYTLIASRIALAQGLGEGNKGFDLPPPAALDDAAAGAARQPDDRRRRRACRRIPGCAISTIRRRIHRLGRGAEARSRRSDAARGGGDRRGTPRRSTCIKPTMTAGERAVLESLQQRRQELETRARELEVRDSLLKAAEKRIEQRLQELKEMEARVTGASSRRRTRRRPPSSRASSACTRT